MFTVNLALVLLALYLLVLIIIIKNPIHTWAARPIRNKKRLD